ncbi:hypothetical protein LRS06_11025 [Hymenobacter sp. J193]|uniref:hypothetical protein n=1 Tax=Hymenobacter sp. J193 TaxID=2898429 RepID=UPI0021506C7F|nr:hypothetical protein [Hymenobacter sp. J193]MCR5888287.1 hypothetical protein [Hymenobacter sp. J193]
MKTSFVMAVIFALSLTSCGEHKTEDADTTTTTSDTPGAAPIAPEDAYAGVDTTAASAADTAAAQ